MIRLYAPIWLALALPLLLLASWRPLPTRTLRGLRLALYALLVLALARPLVRLPAREGVVVVVADRSDSLPPAATREQQEWIERLTRAMPSRSRLGVVSFAARAAVEQMPRSGAFAGFTAAHDPDGSMLGEALETALALIPRTSAGRLLLLSDGLATDPEPEAAALTAAARGIPLDYRSQSRGLAADGAVLAFDTPTLARPREGVLLTVWISLPASAKLPVRLLREGAVIAAEERDLPAGTSRLLFRDRLPASGVLRYDFEMGAAPDDPLPENNRARALLRVEAERPLLCLSPRPGSGLAALLRAGGVPLVETTAATFDGSLERLAGYSAVLLENTPASALGTANMERLAAWVRHLGGGLMMTGGRQSYGPGGYFRSPLDPLLPLSMELRREQRKFSLAIALVLDRSGSMMAPAGPGQTKMDLANLGCVQVLDLLSEGDLMSVTAVDSAPHAIVKLAPIAEVRAQRGKILGIKSMGGGIYVYAGLQAAAAELRGVTAGARHIILFADAADTEEPGAYVELLAACRTAGITCSVVGLGTPADTDAELLRDIARRGGGEIYFSSDAGEIPRLFAQDTLSVTRSAFIEEATPVGLTPGLTLLTAQNFEPPPAVGGYNLCYLRDGATRGVVTRDDNQAPLLAFWQAGGGRALCLTAEADGDDAGTFAKWGQAGDFYAGCVRWTMGAGGELPGVAVRQRVERGVLTVDLHLDPESVGAMPSAAPELLLLRDRPGAAPARETRAFRWISPRQLSATATLGGRETLLPAVRYADRPPLTLAPVCLPYSPEFRPGGAAEGRERLRQLARATGGGERNDLAAIWQELRTRRAPRDLTPWLALAALLLLLLEIAERRTGAVSGWRRRRLPPDAPAPARAAPAPTPPRPAQPPTAPAAGTAPAQEATAPAPPPDALQRARERARRRLRR